MREFRWFRGSSKEKRISYEPKLGLLIAEEYLTDSDSEDEISVKQGTIEGTMRALWVWRK